MEQANHFEFQILYEMCLKNLVKQANRFEFQRSVWDVLEEFDELDSSLVFVSTSFIIGFLWLIGGIGSGFIIIFSFVNESLNPGDYNFVRQWFTFIFIYNSVFNFYAIVSLSNWLKFKIYVFRFRNFSVFFYIVYCNIAW